MDIQKQAVEFMRAESQVDSSLEDEGREQSAGMEAEMICSSQRNDHQGK